MSATVQEPVAVDEIFSIRPGPHLDPLPKGAGALWAIHLAWATALLLVSGAGLVLGTESLGLVACGAAVFAIANAAVRRHVLASCHAIHLSVGLLVLMMTHGAEAAGAFALSAGLLVVATLGAGAATRYLRPNVAPLAGMVPWRFRSAYRSHALWYASAGLAATLALVALTPSPVLRVTAIALLPLGLRSYASNLLSRHACRRLWILGEGKAKALRNAQRMLRRTKDPDGNPIYRTRDWAAWVLAGDPD